MLSIFSLLGRFRWSLSRVLDEQPQPQSDESINEAPPPMSNEPSRPPTINPESSGSYASQSNSPSILALVTSNASEISSYTTPIFSIPTTIEPEFSGPDAHRSPLPSISDLNLGSSNYSEFYSRAPPSDSIPTTTDPESSPSDTFRTPSSLAQPNASEISLFTPAVDPQSSGGPDISWSPSPSILALPTPYASTSSLWSPPAASGSMVTTSIQGVPEVFIDASSHGIGLILNKRWLVWTFTPNHPLIPVGRTNIIVSSWSELVAVALGLLTLLATGYRDTVVKLRSDNTGVVKAIKERRWRPSHELDVILQRILSLSEDGGLTLKVSWIRGWTNPADKPSRGKYPPREMMLDYCPEIPHYLAGIIQPVDPNSLQK